MNIERGVETLRACEASLRGLVAEAAASGDYEAVIRLTTWAKGIAGMAAAASLPISESVHPAEPEGIGTPGPAAGPAAGDAARTGHSTGQERSRLPRGRKAGGAAARSGYPRFFRRNGEVVKIGWSKRARKEYQHKAPREAVDRLVARLLEVGAGGELFTTEQLFPLAGEQTDAEIPNYQVYLCLAWLRSEGLVEQEGRQGYRIPDSAGLVEAVTRCWQGLPDRRQ